MSGLRWTGKVFPPYKVATLLSERNQKKGDPEREKESGLQWMDEGFPPSPLAATSQRGVEAPELVRSISKYIF